MLVLRVIWLKHYLSANFLHAQLLHLKKLTAILLSSSYFERINDDDDDDFMISTQFCVILLGTVA